MTDRQTLHEQFVRQFKRAFGDEASTVARQQLENASPEVRTVWERILADLSGP